MAELLHLIFLWASCTVSVIAGRSSPSPSPSPLSPSSSCSGLVMSMMDCLGYVQDGSNVAVPSAECCDELEQVLKASPSCICEGFKMASNFGIKLNMTRAFGLPQACNVQAPDVARCSDESSSKKITVRYFKDDYDFRYSPAPAPAPVVPAPSPAPIVPPPSPSKPVLPPASAPNPAPPVSPPTKSQPSPPPPAPSSDVPPAAPSLAPSPSLSSSWQLSSSLLVLCVGVAVSSFSYLQV